MTRTSYNFGGRSPRRYRNADACGDWALIVASQPERYAGILQDLAQRALHRLGKPHRSQDCSLCSPPASKEIS